ncbi:MAG: acyltransferase family protein [Planctomycetaceae bacterium]
MIARQNNFDLIRLFAALQVAFIHSVDHLSLGSAASYVASLAGIFPGVPIFFFVSGFLITDSWRRTSDLKQFALNRALRIYPALWLCLLVTTGLIVAAAGPVVVQSASFTIWALAQATFVQFYNLESLRGIGVGVINGSLWTISVELQFYCVLPFFLAFTSGRKQYRSLWLCLILSVFLREGYIWLRESNTSEWATKLLGATLLPYFAMFCCGIACQLHWSQIRRWVEGRFAPWLICYCGWAIVCRQLGIASQGNLMSFFQYVPLCGLVLAAAFSYCKLSESLLHGNDYSYGIYLYHMLVINWVIEFQQGSAFSRFFAVVLITFLCAAISWHMLERQCLHLKRSFQRLRSTKTGASVQTA